MFRFPNDMTPRQRWLYAGIILVALALRLWKLDSIPPGLWYDEALYCLNALSIGRGSWPIFFMLDDHPVEPLYVYSLAAAFALFGPEVLVARCVSALWGTAAVALFYPVTRRFFSPRWALVGCFAYAVMRWPLHFSRTIFRAATPPVFIMLVVLFLLRWRERRRRSDALLAGLFLGLGLYTYISFRLVPLFVLLWLAWLTWRGEIVWRRDGRQLAVGALVALLVFAPLGLDFVRHPRHFTGRLDEVSMFHERAKVATPDGGHEERLVRKPLGAILLGLAANARDVALVWFVRGDHVGRHNLPYEPIFDGLSGAVFLLGLARSLARASRKEKDFLPLLWLVVMSATSIFSFGAPNILRIQGAIPAVVILWLGGLELINDALRPRVGRHVRLLLVGALVAWFAAYQLDSYFRRFAQSPAVRNEFLTDMFYEPARRARAVSREAREVWVSPELARHLTFRFVTHGLGNIKELATSESLHAITPPAAVLVSAYWIQEQRLKSGLADDLLRKMGAQCQRVFQVPTYDPERASWMTLPWAWLWWVPAQPTAEAPKR